MSQGHPGHVLPARPSPLRERVAIRIFLAFSPRLGRMPRNDPPPKLAPWERVRVARDSSPPLRATWYPAPEPASGVVLLVHPWLGWGEAYFHRHGRIERLRAAGWDAMTVELTGVTGPPRTRGFFDIDVADGLRAASARAAGRPLHLWGVSAGGYWAHMAVAREGGVGGAFFEDVSPHLIEWSHRMSPRWAPAFRLFYRWLRDAWDFMDLRAHAPLLGARAVAYVSGESDRGVLPSDTHQLAALAGGSCAIVPEAGHLESIKRDPERVCGLALETFARGS